MSYQEVTQRHSHLPDGLLKDLLQGSLMREQASHRLLAGISTLLGRGSVPRGLSSQKYGCEFERVYEQAFELPPCYGP